MWHKIERVLFWILLLSFTGFLSYVIREEVFFGFLLILLFPYRSFYQQVIK